MPDINIGTVTVLNNVTSLDKQHNRWIIKLQ